MRILLSVFAFTLLISTAPAFSAGWLEKGGKLQKAPAPAATWNVWGECDKQVAAAKKLGLVKDEETGELRTSCINAFRRQIAAG